VEAETRLDFRAVTFLFLPEEIEKLEETFKVAPQQVTRTRCLPGAV
jgi:hypothetical protein